MFVFMDFNATIICSKIKKQTEIEFAHNLTRNWILQDWNRWKSALNSDFLLKWMISIHNPNRAVIKSSNCPRASRVLDFLRIFFSGTFWCYPSGSRDELGEEDGSLRLQRPPCACRGSCQRPSFKNDVKREDCPDDPNRAQLCLSLLSQRLRYWYPLPLLSCSLKH